MPVNDKEDVGQKIVDFFTQKPEDHTYEAAGGDDRVPLHERTDDPKADANRFSLAAGEPLPYPGYDEGEAVFSDDEAGDEFVASDERPSDTNSEAHVVDDQGKPL